MTASPALIVLDWGTSTLRALLLDADGTVLARRTEPWGIMHVPNGDFAAAFDAVTADWRTSWLGLNAISSGMIGSAQGWIVAPYCQAPAGVAELAASLTSVPDMAMHIVPGIAKGGEHPDVMRGEETQIAGALALHPALAVRSLVLLPGTHSKWVHVEDGRVRDFTTYMTGELFAVLREHSILGVFAKEADRLANPGPMEEAYVAMEEAFARGVLAAQRSPQGLAPILFSARSMVLADRLAPDVSLQYLSGLLIGEELRCGLSDGLRPAALIGDAALCARYVSALRLVGVNDVPVIDGAAQAGLFAIARRAGLLPS